MQDYRKNAYMEADLQCSNTIQSMEKKLRTACHAADAKIDQALKVMLLLVLSSGHSPLFFVLFSRTIS